MNAYVLTVGALSGIGSQNAGSLGTEQDRGVSGRSHAGQVGGVRDVQEGIQITRLEEVGIYSRALISNDPNEDPQPEYPICKISVPVFRRRRRRICLTAC